MLTAFVTGFAKGATEVIEEKDKEIRDTVSTRMNYLLRKREKSLEEANTRRDELRQQAKDLQALSGNRLTETQIAGILESGQADTVIANLKKDGANLTDEQTAGLFTPGKDYKGTVQDVVGRLTTLKPGAEAMPTEEVEKGAFGLPTRAGAETREKFAKASGVSIDDLYKNKFDKIAEFKPVGRLDLTAFSSPESDAAVKAKFRDHLARATQGLEQGSDDYNRAVGQALKNPEVQRSLSKLRAMIVVDNMVDPEKKGDLTFGNINTIFDRSLKNGLDILVQKGVIRFDPSKNDYVPIIGDADAIGSYIDHKNKIIRDAAFANGLIDEKGNITGGPAGEAAKRALSIYAEIENNRIVSWKNAAQGKTPARTENAEFVSPEKFSSQVNAMDHLSTEEKQKAIDAYNKAYQFNERRQAARPQALPGTTAGKGKPIPKTADGKIDGSKLEAGETYVDGNGVSKIWNGTSFQPVR